MTREIFVLENLSHRPVLTNAANAVHFPLSSDIQSFVAELKARLLELSGVGLAATQLGMPLKIAAIHIGAAQASLREHATAVPLMVLINPRYEPVLNTEIVEDWEGCFSVSDFMAKVPRFFGIRYWAQDENGKATDGVAEGFFARVMQHEIDHLDGILTVNRLKPDSVQGPMAEMMARRRAELSQEKRALYDELVSRTQKR